MITKGQKINERYEIIRTLGEGGMANVYLARDIILDRDVAVKVLRGDLADDEKFVRRFQREAISASSLSHPNIVEMYDVGEDQGQYYIVMEYVEGKTLKSLIKKRGKLTLEEVIDIMLQLTSAVACAHSSYIIHRDIKPQNVLIKEDGTVKITDFGIAMALNSNELTQTNSVMGSVHYLPPEQANGSGATMKSDIYSLGILMFELLTGELPFKGDSAVEIAIKQMKEKIPSVCEMDPTIPQSIENIIIKATAKNPKNRYADARSMNEDLRTCLDDSRANEPKIVLPYPEFDEDRKPKSSAKSQSKTDGIVKEIKTEEVENTKRDNKVLITLFAVFTGIVIVITSIIVLLPIITNQKEIKVPDVSGLDISDAINTLQNEGFKIADQQKEQASDDVPEGKVVKTNPVAGVKKTKGSEITLYISTGNEGFTMEDFTGKNYYTVYGTLTAYGILVIPEKRDVSDSNVDASTILDQSVKAGEKVSKGDTVILYIPNVTTKYPDFTSGDYTKEQIEQFCTQYSINCKFKEVSEASGNYKSGDIIAQSRQSGTQVTSGASLTITIYVKEDVVECNPNEEVCE